MKKVLFFATVWFFLTTWVFGAENSGNLYIEIVVEEKMLYLFKKHPNGIIEQIKKYAVCSFKPGLAEYTLGLGHATKVEFDPNWYPTNNTVNYLNKKLINIGGKPLYSSGMAIGPKDPRNAMGKFKIHLSHSTPRKGSIYRIHGTNDPSSIGKRASGGCTRMNNEDGLDLAKKVKSALDQGLKIEVNIIMNKAASKEAASFFI